MDREKMEDKAYRVLCENQNYMQRVRVDTLQFNPYVIITSDFSPRGAIDSFIIYVKAEREGANGLYVLEIRDMMYYDEDLAPYQCKFNSIYFYSPYTMCNYIPEITRERKIVCYDRDNVVGPLCEQIADMTGENRLSKCEIVDVREKAQEIWPDLPDYELDTLVANLGYDPDEFTDNALGKMNMIRCVYEAILCTKQGNEEIRVWSGKE